MSEVLVKVEIITKKGSVKTVKFPLDQGMYRAISSLSIDEKRIFFAMQYYDYLPERAFQRKTSSIDEVDEDGEMPFVFQAENADPHYGEVKAGENEECFRLLTGLTELQKKIIDEVVFHGRKQCDVARELGISKYAMSRDLSYALAKLRKAILKRNKK